jgi:hypothetical protein
MPQQALGRFGIAPSLHNLIEDVTVLVDRAPEPMLLACDRDDDLVEMPDVVCARLLPPEPSGIGAPEFQGQRRTVS